MFLRIRIGEHKTMPRLILVMYCCLTIASMRLTAQNQEIMLGLTSAGGQYGIGTIYRANVDGTGLAVMRSFPGIVGSYPAFVRLLEGPDGALYGTTSGGGGFMKGIIFRYYPATASYEIVVHFDGVSKGSVPLGSLVSGGNGKLYGVTSTGGAFNKGVFFEFDPSTNSFTKHFDFDGAQGATPYGDPSLAASGMLYGVTSEGGANNLGVIYEFNPATNTLIKKIDMNAITGSKPLGGMLYMPSGTFLGMAQEGGLGLKGTIYEYDPTLNSLTKLNDFDGTNGANPSSHLLHGTNGLIYGVTPNGGSTNQGTLFEFNPATSAITKKIDFNGGSRGVNPYGGLMQASNGKIYGSTGEGVNGWGGIFEYNIADGFLSTLVAFQGLSNGANPRSTPMQASNGKVYGVTQSGGYSFRGVIYELDLTTNACVAKLSFQTPDDGDWPLAPFVQHNNGRLYAASAHGGANRLGVLFEYEIAENNFTKLYDLDVTTGGNTSTALCLASNGLLYGTMVAGGSHDGGTLISYDVVAKNLIKRFDFSPSLYGNPIGVMQASNGKLYGATANGGANNQGTIFEYTIGTATMQLRASFDKPTLGGVAAGPMIEVGNKLLGLARAGGSFDKGTLYEFDPLLGTISKKIDFAGPNGANPTGSLVQVPNGNLFGVTTLGGLNDLGTIFEYNPGTNTIEVRHSFSTSIDGISVQTGLSISPNGLLMGIALQGGIHDLGVLFEFNPNTYAYTKKVDFDGSNGAYPYNSTPVFVSMQSQTLDFESVPTKTFGDQPFTLSAHASSGLPVIFESADPTVATVNGSTVTIVGGGTTVLRATQDGTKDYFPASVDQVLNVNKGTQTINFPTISTKQIFEAPFTINPSASSGLPVNTSSSDLSVATVENGLVTLIAPGTTILTASQPGDAKYLPAFAEQELVVTMVLAAESDSTSAPSSYPNPANQRLYLRMLTPPEQNRKWVDIINTSGQKRQMPIEWIQGNIYEVNVSELAEGIYLIKSQFEQFNPVRVIIFR